MNYKKLIATFLIIFFAPFVSAEEYNILVDKHFSPYAGAYLMQDGYTAFKTLDDIYIPSSEGKRSLLWSLGRTGKLYLEMMLSSFMMVAQHEVFGHGYRAREFDFSHIGYEVNIASGATSFLFSDYLRLNLLQQSALNSAGMEATTILSQQIRHPWFMERCIDNRDALFYVISAIDQPNYIFSTNEGDTTAGNDVNAYVLTINNWFGSNAITKKRLKQREVWDLLDPTLYFAFYTMGRYIATGVPTTCMPMFNVCGYDYLPTPRLLLAPWGPEFQIQNHLVSPNNRYIRLNLRYGNTAFIHSYGIDLMVRPIWEYYNFEFGTKLYLWRQPKMTSRSAQQAKNQVGAAAFVSADYKFNRCWYALSELGYKTSGYIPGDPLGNSWVWRLGIRFVI